MGYDQVIRQVGEIINWYHRTADPTPEQLMDQLRRLVTLLFSYSSYASQTKEEYNGKYFIRKIETIKEKDRLIKNKLAVNKAEVEAMLATEQQFLLEMEAEALAYRADMLIKQANRVADTMRSHLSLLKKEIDHSNIN